MAANGEKQSADVKRVRRPAKKAGTRAVIMPAPESIVPEERGSVTAEVAVRRNMPPAFFRTTRSKHVNAFLRQLIMLLEAGTPLLKSLKTLADRNRAGVRYMILDIAEYVESGNPLWQAFDRHVGRGKFTSVEVNLVKASEATGNLVPVLQRMVTYRERRELLKKRVAGAMLYPVILIVFCVGVFALITGFVIPQFEQIFDKFGQTLPAATQAVLNFSHFLAATWWMYFAGLIVLIVLYVLITRSSRVWRLRFDYLKLRLPVVGPILQGLAIVELSRSLAMLLKSGLSMMNTLELTRFSVGNEAVANVIQNVRDSVEHGEGIEPPLRQSPSIIPPVVADMLVTGEESGQIDRIAEQIADTYQEEVNIKVSTIGDALVPIVTVFLGVVVGALAVALFWPLIQMVTSLNAQGG